MASDKKDITPPGHLESMAKKLKWDSSNPLYRYQMGLKSKVKRAVSKAAGKVKRKGGKRMGRKKQKIAIAPIAGFALGLYPGLEYAYRAAQDTTQGGTWGSRFMNAALYAYAGIDHDATGKTVFSKDGLMVGTVPLIAGTLMGIALHKGAQMAGVNKSIPWFRI